MKNLLLLLLFITPIIMQAQEKVFKIILDPKDGGSNMLVGQISIKYIQADGTCGWYNKGFEKYKLDSAKIKALQAHIKDYNFIVMLGTWCEDTQNLLPQFYKTMMASKYPVEKIELLGVDREKHALNIEHLLLKVEHVPTIIISKGPREIGRIVETIHKENIETELLYLIEKDIENWK